MNRLTYHGHSAFELLTTAGVRIMLDPRLNQNPKSDIKVSDVKSLDFILVSHGHGDHFSDVIELARQTDAMVLASFERLYFDNTFDVIAQTPQSFKRLAGKQAEVAILEPGESFEF